MLASMKGYTYAGLTAFDSTRLIATSCVCLAGHKNETGRLDECRSACTHAVGHMVLFGESLYRDNGITTWWILRSLRTRLKNEEDISGALSQEEIQQLSKDIDVLIKFNLPSVQPLQVSQGTEVGIMDRLELFSATTDKQKPVSAVPRLRDL